jgi:hypothetical protein
MIGSLVEELSRFIGERPTATVACLDDFDSGVHEYRYSRDDFAYSCVALQRCIGIFACDPK